MVDHRVIKLITRSSTFYVQYTFVPLGMLANSFSPELQIREIRCMVWLVYSKMSIESLDSKSIIVKVGRKSIAISLKNS